MDIFDQHDRSREAVLRRVADLVDGREELRVFRRPVLARTFVVRGLADRVVAGVRLPLGLHRRGHRVFHEFPRGLLLVDGPAFHDVKRCAADDVPTVLRLGVGARIKARADLELRGVDVPPQAGGALDVHGALPGIECVRLID